MRVRFSHSPPSGISVVVSTLAFEASSSSSNLLSLPIMLLLAKGLLAFVEDGGSIPHNSSTMGVWCSGNTTVSKTVVRGSIPLTPAK